MASSGSFSCTVERHGFCFPGHRTALIPPGCCNRSSSSNSLPVATTTSAVRAAESSSACRWTTTMTASLAAGPPSYRPLPSHMRSSFLPSSHRLAWTSLALSPIPLSTPCGFGVSGDRRGRLLRVSNRVAGASIARPPPGRSASYGGQLQSGRSSSQDGAGGNGRAGGPQRRRTRTLEERQAERERQRERERAEAAAAARAVGAPTYSAIGLAQKYSRQPFKVLGRALRVSGALGAVAVGVLWDQRNGRLEANMRRRAVQLRKALTALGPTFVKLGQALSTRPDLCPPAYLDELALLQDSLPTFPDAEAFGTIERQLGRPLESIFEVISPEPIAAASLGQVYKAQMRGTGQVVAVKVQRPGIEEAIGLDFFLLRNLCGLVDQYVDSLTTNVVALLDEFADRVYQELNYVQEGRNAERFRALYGDQAGVYVPEVLWDATASNVLCMEWVEGVKLSDAVQLAQRNLDVLALVDIGIQCSLRQLLEFGYFHADPHPGNLLATADGRLAFLDFGMMSETPSKARYAIIGHVVHLVNRDYEAMAQDYYALDFLDPSVDVAPIVPALQGFFDDVLQQSVSELNFKTIVDGLGAVLYQYPFNVPAYYALILRSLTVLEGLALYTDRNFKVLAAAYPYFAKRLLTDPNPYLRDALIELLFKDGTFRWNRLENLLTQGQKDRDFNSTQALRPVLALMLGPDGAPLRTLVAAEAVRVTEALVIGGAVEGVQSLPPAVGSTAAATVLRLQTLAWADARGASGAGGGGGAGAGGAGAAGGGRGARGRVEGGEQASLAETLALREQVLRCWALLQTSNSFNPSSLLPLVEVIQQAEVQEMGSSIATGLLQRLAARSLQALLRPPSPSQQQQLQGIFGLPSSPTTSSAVV